MRGVGDIGTDSVAFDVEGAGASGSAVADFTDGERQDAVCRVGDGRDEAFGIVREHTEAAMDVDDAGAAALVGLLENRVAAVLGSHRRDDVV